ncbi:hypothetical protein BH10ACI3_BH10ACI3_24730 [soil metagenome]
MKNTIGFIVLLAAILGCSSFGKKETTANNAVPTPAKSEPAKTDAPKADPAGLTLEKFDELKIGTKYDEVVKILGSAGTETNSSGSAGNKYASYKWEGKDYARITATFKNGDLQTKNQSNVLSTNSQSAKADVTMAKYDQINTGMTLAEVEKIIGTPGLQTSNSVSSTYKNTGYRWEGDKNARISVIFKDDKVSSKSQSNVK